MRLTFSWLFVVLVFAAAMAVSLASAQTTQAPQMAYVNVSPNFTYCPPPCECCSCDWYCDPYESPYYNIVTPFGQSEQTDYPNDGEPTWSADGTQIAFTRSSDIFVMPAAGGTAINITNTANNGAPAWSPDGARIAFWSTRETSHSELYLMKPDGSAVVRLTYGVASSVWHPAWSPDGGRIAFNCQVESGNSDVCLINSDGTSFVRLTYDPASDAGTTWSPDGASIAFATTRYGPSWEIAVMNADGSGVHQVDAGVGGWNPAWSPDGAKIAFDGSGVDYRYSLIYTMSADGTNVAQFANGFQPAWMPARVPVATLTFVCNGTTCNFDASGSKDSYGTITSYAWSFGDQATGTGATVTHTYAVGSNYTVRLTVTDSNGATGTKFQTVTDVNSAPAATFNFSSNGLRCSFDGSGSRDSDGTIGSYVWNFGDGTTCSGARVSHTYAAFGQYTVTLTVTDNAGATNAHSQTVIANSPPVASFSFSCSKFTCSFDAAGSKDSDGVITSYAWDFGDGKTGSGPAVSHTYKAPPDTYTVTLTVTDNGGATGAQSASVTVVRRK